MPKGTKFQLENSTPVEIPCSFQAHLPWRRWPKPGPRVFYCPLCPSIAGLGNVHRFVQFSTLEWDEVHPLPTNIFWLELYWLPWGTRMADPNGDVQIKCLKNTTSPSLGSSGRPSFHFCCFATKNPELPRKAAPTWPSQRGGFALETKFPPWWSCCKQVLPQRLGAQRTKRDLSSQVVGEGK